MDITLNKEQMTAYEAVKSGRNVFITGGGGTGKSYLLKAIIGDLKLSGKQVIVCAPTGIAATVIKGTTIHRAFNLKSSAAFTPKKLKIVSQAPKVIKKADVIIIDEISMCRMDIFDAIYASLEKVKSATGRMPQVIVTGDFYQLPPVLSNKTGEKELLEKFYKRKIKETYAFLSNSWNKFNFKCIELTEIVRQNEKDFAEALNQARKGDKSSIPFFINNSSINEIPNAPKLYAYNKSVDRANLEELEKLPDKETVFETFYDGKTSSNNDIDIPQLHLKPGCRVMITSNDAKGKYANNIDLIDPKSNWVKNRMTLDKDMYHNGSLGIVLRIYKDDEDFLNDYVVIKLDNGPNIILYRQDYEVIQYKYNEETETIETETLGIYYQFPLRLAYALTIHKSQGQTFDYVNIDPICRNAGQLYVALSRVTDIRNMYLYNEITPINLFANPLVEEFYEHMNEQDYEYSWMIREEIVEPPKIAIKEPKKEKVSKSSTTTKKTTKSGKNGRPARYPNGSKTLRVPVELIDSFNDVLNRICPKDGFNNEELDKFIDTLKNYLND